MDSAAKRATRAGIVIISALVVVSCAGNPVKTADRAAAAEASASQNHSTPKERSLASSESAQNLETTFQMLLNDSDAVGRFKQYLGRVASIYLVAEAVVKEFDKEVDGAFLAKRKIPLARMDSYKKVQAMWHLTMRERTKIEYVYRRLLETERSESDSAKQVARRVRVEFDNYLFRHSGIERIAFHELMVELNEIRVSMGERPHRIAESRELKSLLRRYAKEMEQKAADEKAKNTGLSQELDAVATELQSKEIEGRNPQSDTIFPSAGKNGNITGGALPAGTWALTYDDGPSGRHTPVILQNLQDNNMKATFFWLAQNASQGSLAGVVQSVGDAGMERANHSWSHANLPTLGSATLQHEIAGSTERLTDLYGEKPRFFRCPYGAGLNVTRIRQSIADQDMVHVFWNVDSLDWQDKNAASVLARVKKQMAVQGSGVVLFHDIHLQSVEASRMLMEWSQDQEIRWVTMSEAMDTLNGKEIGAGSSETPPASQQ